MARPGFQPGDSFACATISSTSYCLTAKPSPHNRHQPSLGGIIDFSLEQPLGADERVSARRRFYPIVNHFEGKEKNNSSSGSGGSNPYNRLALVRLTYEYAAFFRSMALSITGETSLHSFADYLLDNFFLPLKASTKRNPQPPPAERFAGRPERLSSLRATCLIRDRHLCVISRRFGQQDALKRMKEDRKGAKDDDGNLLVSQPRFGKLEVAHILPRSLTRIGSGSELSASKQAAIAILNMLDGGVGHLIQGTDIDQPRNALTLTADLHELFCDFPIYFNSTEQAHTYEINSFVAPSVFQDNLPVARALYLTPTRTIDPPSPRFLAIHRAIAHILHLSAG
ncbi:hypothetical protein F5X98DRAFT_367467 [Xylaria grammica]|nr:hypothetical protein F5X98DRAFT_367467 [Xylaria grammica]